MKTGGEAFPFLRKLLSPTAALCLSCGKPNHNHAYGYPEICKSCFMDIPWITEIRCRTCGRSVGCPDCTRKGGAAESRHYRLNRSAVSYRPMMKEWLAQFKFRGNEAFAPLLARMIGAALSCLEAELRGDQRKRPLWHQQVWDAVAYVPISEHRMVERGFNQAEVLAAAVARQAGVPVLDLLERTQHTVKQSFKGRKERLLDLQQAFQPAADAIGKLSTAILRRRSAGPSRHRETVSIDSLAKTHNEPPVTILLVDDVYTTGSTLNACASVLLHVCAVLGRQGEIHCLTWARS